MQATGLKDKSDLTQTSTQRTKNQMALEETLQKNIPALCGQSLGGQKSAMSQATSLEGQFRTGEGECDIWMAIK